MHKNFKSFWSALDADEKRELAEGAETSVAYLAQVASGYRGAGTKTIAALVAAHDDISLEMFFGDAA